MKVARHERPARRSRPAARALLVGGLLAAATMALATQRDGDPKLYGPEASPGDTLTVYVSYNFFHSDLEVPRRFLARGDGPSAMAVASLRSRPWIALGWGDATFYQGRGFGVGRAFSLLRSAVWPVNASVVHLEGEDDPTAPSPGWRTLRLTLSPRGAERLRRRLDATFALQGGRPIAIVAAAPKAPSALGPRDAQFFRSAENAWALHVCNHWTGELLNAAGTPVTPVLDLTTAGLAADLRWRAHAVPVSARAQ